MAEKSAKPVKNPRIAMPEQDPQVRARNFLEVPTGYTNKMAQEEAARCLQCKKPACVNGCPVGVDIPGFIDLMTALVSFERVFEGISPRRSATCGAKMPCPPSAAGSALRKYSVRASASSARRVNRWPSATWSAIAQTGNGKTEPVNCRPRPPQPVKKSPLSAQAHQVSLWPAI